MLELFMYVYSCNALSARFFDVDRALNSYFMIYDYDCDPMTFMYKLDPYSLDLFRMCRYKLLALRLSKVIV